MKKKILIIMKNVPHFDRSAGEKRYLGIIAILCGKYEVYFRPHQSLPADRPQLQFLRESGIKIVCNIADCLSKNEFYAVIVEDYRLFEYYFTILKLSAPGSFLVLAERDLHFLRKERESQTYRSAGLLKEAEAVKTIELKAYAWADLAIMVTDEEKDVLHAENQDLPVEIIPCMEPVPEIFGSGLKLPVYGSRRVSSKTGKRDLLFVGNFKHAPNEDAVMYFCRDIWPAVRRKLGKVNLYIAGNSPTEKIEGLENENITVTGHVPDLSPFWESCLVSIAPLRYGAGMKGKVLEAMAWGVPVVTTSAGAQGMNLRNGTDALICDDARCFAQAVIRLYGNAGLRKRLIDNGKKVARRYSFENVNAKLLEIFADLDKYRRGKPKKLTSIIILCHNQLSYTRQCVKSILKHTLEPYELVFVDNGSTDGTNEYLKKINNAIVISNDTNLGFSKGCNQGIRKARGDYIILLNNDTIVTSGWLGKMKRCAGSNASIGMVGPRTNHTYSFQHIPNPGYRSIRQMHAWAEALGIIHCKDWYEVVRLTGFCLLIKREIIEKIGFLDERFSIGTYEDYDYSLRVMQAGYKLMCAGDVFVHHFGSKSFAPNNIDRQTLCDRNREIFLEKWQRKAQVFLETLHPNLFKQFDEE